MLWDRFWGHISQTGVPGGRNTYCGWHCACIPKLALCMSSLMRWVTYRYHFLFCTSLLKHDQWSLTVKEVTKVKTREGTMCGKIFWKEGTCYWCPPPSTNFLIGHLCTWSTEKYCKWWKTGWRLGNKARDVGLRNIPHRSYLNYTFAWRQSTEYLPKIFMVLFWSGSIPTPSWQMTTVPLRSGVAFTVAVDVILDPVISVTLNWKGGWLEITLPWSRGRSDWMISREGTSHRCAREDILHVNVTLSPGHGLSTLDCNWATETENEHCCCIKNNTLQSFL